MSMIRCEDCETIFDSDSDPDCFVEVGNMRRLHKEIVLCEGCRDHREIEPDEPATPRPRQLTEAERHAIMERGMEADEGE